MTEAEAGSVEEVPEATTPKRKGLLGRLRRRKSKEGADERDQTPSPKPAAEARTPPTDDEGEWVNSNKKKSSAATAAGAVVLEEKESLKQVRFPAKQATKQVPIYKRKELAQAPTARESAFGGPPRYDWIDIETSAAVKVQSVARRNKTMKELEEQGITTAAIRNRSRRRKAKMADSDGFAGSADIPNLFACCGVGLAFGEATEEHYVQQKQHEKEQYLERKKEKAAKEEALRKTFLRMSAQKKSMKRDDVQEVFEMVEEDENDNEEQNTMASV